MSVFTINSKPSSTGLARFGRLLMNAALEFIYPPACLLCHHELPSQVQETDGCDGFCDACMLKLTSTIERACRRCGAPVGPFTIAEDHCILCRRENFAFDEVVRLGLYQEDLRMACLMAKNQAGLLMGRSLADLLVDAKHPRLQPESIDLVVPIPEHWLKRIFRQQYAAETMARQIADRLKLRLSTGILGKVRWTPKQAKSPPVQRRQQQKQAFRAVRQAVNGKSILLVDDILTTGATADSAARELKRAGARRVVVAVMAVSPPRV